MGEGGKRWRNGKLTSLQMLAPSWGAYWWRWNWEDEVILVGDGFVYSLVLRFWGWCCGGWRGDSFRFTELQVVDADI